MYVKLNELSIELGGITHVQIKQFLRLALSVLSSSHALYILFNLVENSTTADGASSSLSRAVITDEFRFVCVPMEIDR
jgi:hypothetical protein